MLLCVGLNAASTLSFSNVFQHSLGVLNFASRGQIVQTEVMDRTTAETFCLRVSFSCKTEMSFRRRCFLIVADERNIPAKSGNKEDPSQLNHEPDLRLMWGSSAPHWPERVRQLEDRSGPSRRQLVCKISESQEKDDPVCHVNGVQRQMKRIFFSKMLLTDYSNRLLLLPLYSLSASSSISQKVRTQVNQL